MCLMEWGGTCSVACQHASPCQMCVFRLPNLAPGQADRLDMPELSVMPREQGGLPLPVTFLNHGLASWDSCCGLAGWLAGGWSRHLLAWGKRACFPAAWAGQGKGQAGFCCALPGQGHAMLFWHVAGGPTGRQLAERGQPG